ncbi:MAG: Rrf2 family transcriptional regulator [Verrucomicrobia bacterium]|nr:Rrf2 family transcriptional regulator [Verrucomicrobiota bacterium]
MITISARVQYACLAVLELAKHTGSPRPTRIEEIATEQGIPKQFLVHILLQMKQKGILASVRGVGGGYALAKPPSEITVGDVVRAVGSTLTTLEGRSSGRAGENKANAVFFSLWRKVEQEAIGVLDKVRFDELLRGQANSPEYVI